MASATTVEAPPTDGVLSHKQILTIFAGLMMGMFLAALDQTIVATAIRTIADDLHGLSVQAWVTTAYLITSTIATPLYGKLSDIYGRKKFFISAITIFIIGSALCSFATSMYMLAGFRALQGVGAGGLFSLALAIIGDIVSPRERAKYQGYFLAVFGTSSVLGPVIGGFFAGADNILGLTGWRWVFLVNVPIGFAALFVVSKTLHLHHIRHDHRIDWWGATALIVALVPLLTVAQQGRTWGWGSTRALVFYAVGAIGVIGFVAAEARMREEALIPLRIFKNRAISVTIIGSVIVGVGMFGGIVILPLYLQIVHGASPTMSGFLTLPMVLGIMIASILSGQLISRTGVVRPFPIIGTGLMIAGLLLLRTIGADTPLLYVELFMFVFGLGLGNTMQPLTLIVQNAVSPREIGMATSSATFFRQMGGTIGVAVFLSILFSTVGAKIGQAFEAASQNPAFQAALHNPQVLADPTNKAFAEALSRPDHGAGGIAGVINDSSIIGQLNPAFAHPLRAGFSDSMDQVFLIGACVVFIGFVVLWFLPRIELRTQSGMAAAASERAALDDPGQEARTDLAHAAAAQVAGHTMDEDAGRAVRKPHSDAQPSVSQAQPSVGQAQPSVGQAQPDGADAAGDGDAKAPKRRGRHRASRS